METQVQDVISNMLRALLSSQTLPQEKLLKAELIVAEEPGFLQLGSVLQPPRAGEQGQGATSGVIQPCSAQVSGSYAAFCACHTSCQ